MELPNEMLIEVFSYVDSSLIASLSKGWRNYIYNSDIRKIIDDFSNVAELRNLKATIDKKIELLESREIENNINDLREKSFQKMFSLAKCEYFNRVCKNSRNNAKMSLMDAYKMLSYKEVWIETKKASDFGNPIRCDIGNCLFVSQYRHICILGDIEICRTCFKYTDDLEELEFSSLPVEEFLLFLLE